MQPIDSMAVPCLRDGGWGIEGRRLLVFGKRQSRPTNVKSGYGARKLFAHPTVKGSVTKGVTNTLQGWLKPDVGLTEGDEDDEGGLLTARFNRVSVTPARRCGKRASSPIMHKVRTEGVRSSRLLSDLSVQGRNVGDYWQIMTPQLPLTAKLGWANGARANSIDSLITGLANQWTRFTWHSDPEICTTAF